MRVGRLPRGQGFRCERVAYVSQGFGSGKIFVLAALLAYPCAMVAQHGGGGGRIGGASAGGGGLSGGNRATGIENKDDLRGFHEIMAVQATSEQKIAYAVMAEEHSNCQHGIESLYRADREREQRAGSCES